MFIKEFPINMNREEYARNYGMKVVESYKYHGDPTPIEAMGQEICRLQYDKEVLCQQIKQDSIDRRKADKVQAWMVVISLIICVALGVWCGIGIS